MSESTTTESRLDKLAPALVGLQADLKPVEKSAANPFFKSKYAPLPAVMEAVQPLLAKHKLAVSQFVTHLDGQSALRTLLIHESGQLLEDVQPLLLTKQDPQAQGSAITYARRYGVMAVLGLVADEDDDGNAASARDSFQSTRPVAISASPDKPASQKQIDLLGDLLSAKGFDDSRVKATLDTVRGNAAATSDMISKLKGEETAPERTWK